MCGHLYYKFYVQLAHCNCSLLVSSCLCITCCLLSSERKFEAGSYECGEVFWAFVPIVEKREAWEGSGLAFNYLRPKGI